MLPRFIEIGVALVLFLPRYTMITAVELFAFFVCFVTPMITTSTAALRWVIATLARVLLWNGGFLRLRVRGVPDQTTQLFVCNHLSYLDGIVLTAKLNAPSFLASAWIGNLPMFGTILHAMGLIYVSLDDKQSRGAASDAIVRHLRDLSPTAGHHAQHAHHAHHAHHAQHAQHTQQDPPHTRNTRPLVIFPEGEIGSCKQLLPFKLGAFRPGVAIQPIIIRYPRARTGTIDTTMKLAWLFLNLHNECEICFLPTIFPTEAEKKDAPAFSSRARQAMQHQLLINDWFPTVVPTHHRQD